MISEIDIYRAAKLIIDQHGNDALIEAAYRQDIFLAEGNLDAAKVWLRIGNAIEWMLIPKDLNLEEAN